MNYAPGVIFAIGSIAALFLILSPGLLMMHRRFSLPAILLSSTFIWLLIVVPLGSGQSIGNLSWGMYYNRHGWAAFFFILLFYVEPREITKQGKWLDGGLLAMLVRFALYCKITYGLIAISFIVANMLVSKYNRSVSFIALFFILFAMGLIELNLEIHQGYLNSIMNTINNREAVRGGIGSFVISFIEHANSLIIAVLALFYTTLLGRKKTLDWLFVIGCSVVCIILLDQNGGTKGIPSLLATIICLTELIRRNKTSTKENNTNKHHSVIFMLALIIIFIAEPLAKRSFTLYSQYVKSIKLKPITDAPKKLASFLVPSHEDKFVGDLIEKSKMSAASLDKVRSSIEHTLTSYEYYLTINDGVKLLTTYNKSKDTVFVLDLANPFSFILDLKPKKYGHPFKWGWPSGGQAEIFDEVEYVMEPLLPYQTIYSDKAKPKYIEFLSKNYNEIATSSFWKLWKKN
jgi:hypothetical protein